MRWLFAAVMVPVVAVLVGLWVMQAPPPRVGPDRILAGSVPYQARQATHELVPLQALLANPQTFEGRKVRVQGWVTLGFEDSGLHPDRASHEGGVYANAVRLDPPRSFQRDRSHWPAQGRYAEVAGTFRSGAHAGMGLYSGALEDLKSAAPLFSASEYWRQRNQETSWFLLRQVLSPWCLTLFGWWGLWTVWGLRRAARSS